MPIYLTGDRVSWQWSHCGHCTGVIVAIAGEYAEVRGDVGKGVVRVLLTSLSHCPAIAFSD